ncbi:MAG: DUF1566 domain-containing protein [Ignavibacteriae bacterium]|nr:DUF1566 domain-containing protein [Ignavibacteria bacterium]MBI3364803.1 DUF1566 domain-containing protein [Ignavibacteriota bacterium]
MKHFFVLFVICAIALQGILHAQIPGPPHKISYQGALTYLDSHGKTKPVKKGRYKLTFEFFDDAAAGNLLYSESDSVTADKNGIYVVTIGENGTPSGQLASNFGVLNWLKVTINGGPETHISYPFPLARVQFTSVPYALSADSSNYVRHLPAPPDSVRASHTADIALKGAHYIGESYGGGIVFYVDASGQHGLIAATADQSTNMRWYAGTYTYTMANADGVGAGKANTAIIIANQGYGDGSTYAARVCNEYSVTVDGVTYGDWYLPSKYELNLLYLQKAVVGGFADNYYWSSTQLNSNGAGYQDFLNGTQNYASKNGAYYVRAVRAF